MGDDDLKGYLNIRQAAAYVGYQPSPDAATGKDRQIRNFREWVRRHDVPRFRRGRNLLFRATDLDAALTPVANPQPFDHSLDELIGRRIPDDKLGALTLLAIVEARGLAPWPELMVAVHGPDWRRGRRREDVQRIESQAALSRRV